MRLGALLLGFTLACGSSKPRQDDEIPTVNEPDEPRGNAEPRPLEQGKPAPEFALPDADGRTYTLSELRAGGPVVVVFYQGSWCGTCREQLKRFQDKGDQFVGLSSRLAAPFDAEGVPRRRVAVIERGVGGRPLVDLHSAARLADERGSTGHAQPLGEDLTEGPLPANLVLEPGDRSEEELVAGVERGLWVTRFHYVNGLLDTRRATMTGMTRDGTFMIEDGKVGRAVRNLRFTDGILDALSTRLGGIGRDLHARPAHWTSGGVYLAPAVHLRRFHFTGKSR